jgi:hypothetical protein
MNHAQIKNAAAVTTVNPVKGARTKEIIPPMTQIENNSSRNPLTMTAQRK